LTAGGHAGATSVPEDVSFWDYSLALYGCPGVEQACLGLQDRLGLDVNLLLFCCWRAAAGRGGLSQSDAARLVAVVAGWQHEVVRSLRALRRRLKEVLRTADDGPAALFPDDAGELRERVKRLELDAERLEQLALERAAKESEAQPAASPMTAAAASFAAYLGVVAITPAVEDETDLATLLAAAFPEQAEGAASVLRLLIRRS
jgi:uncharacterized protein (TIGR02444 family)